MPEHQIHT